MKRILAALTCAIMLLGSMAGLAEDAHLYDETAAWAQPGLETYRETTFTWGGLPLLDAELDKTLESLLKAFSVQTRSQSQEDGGYCALDILLQDVSVLDIAFLAKDGLYYETSNLLAGGTLAFSPEEFSTFVGRVSAKSQGALPVGLDGLYPIAMRALAAGDLTIDADTISDALAAYGSWQDDVLIAVERLRPVVHIPGLYGVKAAVTSLHRDDLIALAQTYADLLSENEALWQEAAAAQLPGADEAEITENAQRIAQTMRALPKLLSEWLPADLAPTEYREVLDGKGAIVVTQLEIPLPDGQTVYAEWTPQGAQVPAFYALVTTKDLALSVLTTQEIGPIEVEKGSANQRNVTLQEWRYAEDAFALDVLVTRTENVQTRQDKLTRAVRTEYAMQSDVLFGEDQLVSLVAQTQETVSGNGKDVKGKTDTTFQLKGLGFDTRDILTVSSRKSLRAAEMPVNTKGEVLRPAQMDTEAFDTWFEGVQVGIIQAGMTVLGRLPADVAAYLLTLWE